MNIYIFECEGIRYTTNADTIEDAENKFELNFPQEERKDSIYISKKLSEKELDKLKDNDEVVFF